MICDISQLKKKAAVLTYKFWAHILCYGAVRSVGSAAY